VQVFCGDKGGKRLVVAALLAVLALWTCASAVLAAEPPGAGWVVDQAGSVSLERPAGWRLQEPTDDGRIELTGTDGDTLTVWPFLLRERLSASGASGVLTRLSSLVSAAIGCTPVETVGDRTIRCASRHHPLAADPGAGGRHLGRGGKCSHPVRTVAGPQ